MKKPNDIPGLVIWLDAADSSTVLSATNSTPGDGGQIRRMIDKKSGVTFSNTSNGPTYSYTSVNGKNSILMADPSTGPFVFATNKALVASDLTILSSATTSIFCVYKPIGDSPASDGARQWVMAINDYYMSNIRTRGNGSNFAQSAIPNKGISVNFETPSLDRSSAYWESNTPLTTEGLRSAVTYYDHLPSRNKARGYTNSIEKVNLTIARTQNNLKKISFIYENNDWVDDFSGGFNNPNNVYKLTGPVYGLTYSENTVNLPLGTQSMAIGTIASGVVRTGFYHGFYGYFCELLYYNRFLSDYETNSLKAYLREKWFQPDVVTPEVEIIPEDPTKAPIIGSLNGPFGLVSDNGEGYYGYFTADFIERLPDEKGFIWSTTNFEPTLQDFEGKQVFSTVASNSPFGGLIPTAKNWTPDIIYFVRAYGRNVWGTGYSSTRMIYTKPVDLLIWAPINLKGTWGYTASVVASEIGKPGIINKGLILGTVPITIFGQTEDVEIDTLAFNWNGSGQPIGSQPQDTGIWVDSSGNPTNPTNYLYARAYITLDFTYDPGDGIERTLTHLVYSNQINR